MAITNNRQCLVFQLADQAYGFDLESIREIVSLREARIHHIPEAPQAVEGVVLLRDRTVEVIDVRSALGMCSLHDETASIAQLLHEREEDHCRWVEELEACVRESREFRLATDPHKCKFGQWYDALMANHEERGRLTNNDLALNSLLERLKEPHQRLHAVAEEVLRHATAGRAQQAQRIVDETRNGELSALRQLLARCREQFEVARRGVLVVFSDDDGLFGGLVDRVFEVVRFAGDRIQSVDHALMGDGVVGGVAEWGNAGKMVQLLDVAAIAKLRRAGHELAAACSA